MTVDHRILAQAARYGVSADDPMLQTTGEKNDSPANWDPDQPRACFRCDRTLRISKDSIVMQRFPRRATFCPEHFA